MNRLVLITGCYGGLGSNYCSELLSEGYSVIGLDCVRKDFQFNGNPNFNFFKVDLKYDSDIESCFRELLRLDLVPNVIIANAAVTGELLHQSRGEVPKFEDVSKETLLNTFDINIVSSILLAKHSLKIFGELKTLDTLIFISSMYALKSPNFDNYKGLNFTNFVGYSTSKAAVNGLVPWLSSYLRDRDITVIGMSPGPVKNNHDERFVRRISADLHTNRMATPHDMYKILRKLIDGDVTFLTGSIIDASGGYKQ